MVGGFGAVPLGSMLLVLLVDGDGAMNGSDVLKTNKTSMLLFVILSFRVKP